MEWMSVLLLLLLGAITIILILSDWLNQSQQRQNELVNQVNYLESRVRQIELSTGIQRPYGVSPSRGWGWVLVLIVLVVLVVYLF